MNPAPPTVENRAELTTGPDEWAASHSYPQGLTAADLLRLFDSLRRHAARDRHGSEGAFLGYDGLRLSCEVNCEELLEIRATARLVATRARLDTVTYIAEATSKETGRRIVLATATGMTAMVNRGRPDGSQPADPHAWAPTRAVDRPASLSV